MMSRICSSRRRSVYGTRRICCSWLSRIGCMISRTGCRRSNLDCLMSRIGLSSAGGEAMGRAKYAVG